MLEAALEEKQAERKRWINLNVKGRINDDELEEALVPLDREIEQLQSSIELANDAVASYELNKQKVHEIKATIENFREYIKEKMPDEEKRKYVTKLIKRVVLHDDEIEIFTSWDITEKSEKPSNNNGNNNSDRSHEHGSKNSNLSQKHGRPSQPVYYYPCRVRARD